MKSKWLGLLIFLPFVLIACGTPGTEKSANLEEKLKSGKKLATLNGTEIHEGYLELLKQINPNIEGQLKTPAGKKRLVDNLLEQELLYQESVKRGIHKLPKYQEKVALYERVILAQGLLEEEIDVQSKKYYDENKDKEFSQVKLAHILVRIPGKDAKPADEAKAKEKAEAALKKLNEGAAWEEVVQEYSEDRLSQNRGGELGDLSRQDRRAERLGWSEFVEEAFTLKAGEVKGPYKAKDGYHIIKVLEAAQVAPYEEVQNRVQFKLRGQVKEEVLSSLTGENTPEYQDEELKVPQPGLPGQMPALPEAKKPQAPEKPPVQSEAEQPAAQKAPEK